MAERDLVLGIDAGGSKTLLAVAERSGALVLLRRFGGLNPFDQPDWRGKLAAAITDLGATRARIAAAAAGMAGFGELDSVSLALSDAMAELLPCPHSVHNDVQVAFDGAFQDRAGVLLLAGTGSMAWAQSSAFGADPVRVGGWGHDIGDEGSAFWIGQRAVSIVSQVLDGRASASPFADAILARIGSAGLLGWYYGLSHRRSGVASLARDVVALADSGDATAERLIDAAAEHLCALVDTARRRIGEPDLPWSFAGGLLDTPLVRDAATRRLGPAVAPNLPPIGGAVWRAARAAGWTTDDGWRERLASAFLTMGSEA